MSDPKTAVVLLEFSRIYSMPTAGRCRAEGASRPKDDWCSKWIPATGDEPLWPNDIDELLAGFPYVVPKE